MPRVPRSTRISLAESIGGRLLDSVLDAGLPRVAGMLASNLEKTATKLDAEIDLIRAQAAYVRAQMARLENRPAQPTSGQGT